MESSVALLLQTHQDVGHSATHTASPHHGTLTPNQPSEPAIRTPTVADGRACSGVGLISAAGIHCRVPLRLQPVEPRREVVLHIRDLSALTASKKLHEILGVNVVA